MRPVVISPHNEIFKNHFLRLYSVKAEFPTGSREYFVTEKRMRVGVLVIRDGQLLLVRQYRLLIDSYSWEIPGGGVDDGETPFEAAARECLEEAGVLCRELTPVFGYRLGLDVTDCEVQLFRAVECSGGAAVPLRHETDERMWVPLGECLRKVRSGEVQDLMTIVAILWATHPETA